MKAVATASIASLVATALLLVFPASSRATGSLNFVGTGSAAVLQDPDDTYTTIYASSGDMANLDLTWTPSPYDSTDGTVSMVIGVDTPYSDDQFVGPYFVTADDSLANWNAGIGSFTDFGPDGYRGWFSVGPTSVSAYLAISQYPVYYPDNQVQLTFQASTIPEPSSLVMMTMGGLCVAGVVILRRK